MLSGARLRLGTGLAQLRSDGTRAIEEHLRAGRRQTCKWSIELCQLCMLLRLARLPNVYAPSLVDAGCSASWLVTASVHEAEHLALRSGLPVDAIRRLIEATRTGGAGGLGARTSPRSPPWRARAADM